ncbi:hypothetical protein BT96DRAFT_40366 [Gymnopus androsaceus JB14]|uniref:Uncharacterized protein n=1 Tax=Gymnopus androsaceus JB14 TaxID=1447944 RepID=A0A6A4HKX4_9AGAR|nr:hypothetical protein BT96DRAFT_40366 [Gymnopus androsaceus JB14]
MLLGSIPNIPPNLPSYPIPSHSILSKSHCIPILQTYYLLLAYHPIPSHGSLLASLSGARWRINGLIILFHPIPSYIL